MADVLHGDRHTVVAPVQDPPKRGLSCLGTNPMPCPASHFCFPAVMTLLGRSASPGTCWQSTPRVGDRAAGGSQQGPIFPPLGQAGPEGFPNDSSMGIPPFPTGYSGWVSLSEVDPDEEVQGEIHLRVEVLGSQGSRRLRCSVLEAR